MVKKLWQVFIIFIFILFFSSTFLSPLYAEDELPVFFPGIRALGMGNAFLAFADDQNAFFYNPAGIIQREKIHFSFLDLPIIFNSDTYALGKYLYSNLFGTDKTELDLFEVINRCVDNTMRIYTGPPVNINFISPPMGYFSFGVGLFLGSLTAEQTISSGLLTPVVDLWLNADSALIIPVAYEIIPNLSLGINLKALSRERIEISDTSLLDLLSLQIPELKVGYGVGLDAGILYYLTQQLNIGATLLDITGTEMVYSKSIDPIKTIEQKKPVFLYKL